MSSINTLFEMETGSTPKTSELEEKKSTLRALKHRRDHLAAEIGYRVRDTISSYPLWIIDQVNFDDPRIADIKDEFFQTEEKISKLDWEVSRLEAIRDGELPRHEAKVKVYKFLQGMSDKNQIAFLQSHSLSTTSLTEAVLLCPGLLDNMTDFEENLELIRSNPQVWW